MKHMINEILVSVLSVLTVSKSMELFSGEFFQTMI